MAGRLPIDIVCRARARQRRLAVLACALWCLGHEVLPDLHLGLHDHLAPHHHDGDTVVADDDHDHDHGGGWPTHHHHDDAGEEHEDHHHDGEPADTPGLDHPDPDHGAHSLAHRTRAIAAPAPAITEPLPSLWWATQDLIVVLQSAVWRPLIAALARGPPANSGRRPDGADAE